jgi:hypothetical protein
MEWKKRSSRATEGPLDLRFHGGCSGMRFGVRIRYRRGSDAATSATKAPLSRLNKSAEVVHAGYLSGQRGSQNGRHVPRIGTESTQVTGEHGQVDDYLCTAASFNIWLQSAWSSLYQQPAFSKPYAPYTPCYLHSSSPQSFAQISIDPS